MSRLIDDIRAGKPLAPPGFTPPELLSAWQRYANSALAIMRAQLPGAPIVVIDNVSDYYYTGSDQEYWGPKDFPNVAPPWPAFWAEHRFPKRIHSKERGDTDTSEYQGRTGMFVYDANPICGDMARSRFGITESKWLLGVELFLDFGFRYVNGPFGTFFIAVSESGEVAQNTCWAALLPKDIEPPDFNAWLNPLMLAISFLHCKNVTLEEHPVAKPLVKKFERKHGIKPSDYKTLVIEPLKQVLRREGHSDANGLQRAMHICRGHFADYTEGRGLFGKYHGRFWMPMHVKGTGDKPKPREVEIRL